MEICEQKVINSRVIAFLLDFGNGKLNDGIQKAVNLARIMDVIRKSETNEEIKIWERMFLLI